ncbi:hypothetical protein [Alicyclobacillus herbarius]|uniref:hypothetical protein n=1 Tax=Alicyclobacillus herbarius TaxID=122960 RepID=UPI000411FE87|nr:hypothetical protein [Alicyclobacillus herbarius]
METRIDKIYILSVEEPGDFVFSPAGVVILLENKHFKVYSSSSEHNRYRATLQRYSWKELEDGIHHRGADYRLEDVTADMARHGWVDASSTPDILHCLYETNPRQMFFLKRVLQSITDSSPS